MNYKSLDTYNGFSTKLKPTTDHNQCLYNEESKQCIINPLFSNSGFDPKTCYFPNYLQPSESGIKCYSNTALMCNNDSECVVNPNLKGCEKQSFAGITRNTCKNADPRAPQCISDDDCKFFYLNRNFSVDPKKGSYNCRNLGSQSWCATPNVQCINNNQCYLRGGSCHPRNGATGGYKCKHSPNITDSCRCLTPLPKDVTDYRLFNPTCTPELIKNNIPCKFPGYY